MWLTWANGLTAVRGLLILPLVGLVGTGRWSGAAVVFSLAVLSDLLDGPVARRRGENSTLGGLLDHAADASLVAALLAALAYAGHVPWLLAPLVAVSFVQYMLDSRALAGGALRASWLGRSNGIGYFVVAALPVYRNAFGFAWPPDPLIQALAWLLVATTVISMADRFRAWRRAE